MFCSGDRMSETPKVQFVTINNCSKRGLLPNIQNVDMFDDGKGSFGGKKFGIPAEDVSFGGLVAGAAGTCSIQRAGRNIQ